MQITPGPVKRTVTNAARREQIVRAAIAVIAEHGYDKVSFAKITAEARLSSPRMISYHFASKGDLIDEIVTHIVGGAARFIAERMAAEPTVTGKLRGYLEANLQYLRDHPEEMLALTEIGPHARVAAGERYTPESAQEPSLRGLEALLEAGQRSGEFRQFDIPSMAVLIRAGVDAAAPRLRGSFDLDAYSRELIASVELATRGEAW